MAMLVVVEFKERSAKLASFGEIGKCRRELRHVFRGLEGFDKGIVVRDMRARMAFCHSEIGEKKRDGL